MKRKPSAKHAHQVLGNAIDAAIKAHKEFEATVGAFEVANTLILRAALTAGLVDNVASVLALRRGDGDDAVAELRAIARTLRDAGAAGREALG